MTTRVPDTGYTATHFEQLFTMQAHLYPSLCTLVDPKATEEGGICHTVGGVPATRLKMHRIEKVVKRALKDLSDLRYDVKTGDFDRFEQASQRMHGCRLLLTELDVIARRFVRMIPHFNSIKVKSRDMADGVKGQRAHFIDRNGQMMDAAYYRARMARLLDAKKQLENSLYKSRGIFGHKPSTAKLFEQMQRKYTG